MLISERELLMAFQLSKLSVAYQLHDSLFLSFSLARSLARDLFALPPLSIY